MYENDHRIVMTLDAGGTNFVFSAIQGDKEIVTPIACKAVVDDTDRCLETLKKGFSEIRQSLPQEPVAISFAFPGPADYANGVIGDCPNFPAFRGGVPLGPILERHFGIPVFINNDGNLFAYGEALSGALPQINAMLKERGGIRSYSNLLGITLGTGFGGGVVTGNRLLYGDNGCGGDVWLMRNRKYPSMIAEESVSARAVCRVYRELSGSEAREITPKDVFDIAEGMKEGDAEAAKASFMELGTMAGAAIADALNIVDGLVVIGGGVSKAHKYILPGVMKEVRSSLSSFPGNTFPRVQMQVCNLMDDKDREEFLNEEESFVCMPGSSEKVPYLSRKKTGIIISSLGTERAMALGAYAYALQNLG